MFGLGGSEFLVVALTLVLAAAAVAFPAARICRRLGFPPWLGILAIVPLANLLLLWFVAMTRWPANVTDRA